MDGFGRVFRTFAESICEVQANNSVEILNRSERLHLPAPFAYRYAS